MTEFVTKAGVVFLRTVGPARHGVHLKSSGEYLGLVELEDAEGNYSCQPKGQAARTVKGLEAAVKVVGSYF
jgi:hypothetical protein